jgi:hypothetical protein
VASSVRPLPCRSEQPEAARDQHQCRGSEREGVENDHLAGSGPQRRFRGNWGLIGPLLVEPDEMVVPPPSAQDHVATF